MASSLRVILGDPAAASREDVICSAKGYFRAKSLLQERDSPWEFSLTVPVLEASEILPGDWQISGEVSQDDSLATFFYFFFFSRHLTQSDFSHQVIFLISNQFDMRKQNSGAKVLLRNIFSLEIVGAGEGALLWERAAEASSLVCTGLTNPLLI